MFNLASILGDEKPISRDEWVDAIIEGGEMVDLTDEVMALLDAICSPIEAEVVEAMELDSEPE